MSMRMQISQAQLDDLSRVVGIGRDNLSKILAALDQIQTIPLGFKELRHSLHTAADADAESADILARQLVGLARFKRDYSLTSEETIDGLSQSIRTTKEWNESQLSHWGSVRDILQGLISTTPVCVVAKSHDLSFDYENLLVNTRIITDIRPVYDDDHESIIAGIVSQTFRVDYVKSDVHSTPQTLSLALDEKDIRRLASQCEIALRKAKVARSQVLNKCNFRTFTVSEDEHDES